ncbi:hypothetical protein DFJ73DRAFT_504151 [Zopfochytrium polystomum]|nr:hypothetical protein DFJ73DRAFT_504151 [Zopfochytrium polystomum]
MDFMGVSLCCCTLVVSCLVSIPSKQCCICVVSAACFCGRLSLPDRTQSHTLSEHGCRYYYTLSLLLINVLQHFNFFHFLK